MGAWVAETVRNYRAGESEALIPAQGSAAVIGPGATSATRPAPVPARDRG